LSLLLQWTDYMVIVCLSCSDDDYDPCLVPSVFSGLICNIDSSFQHRRSPRKIGEISSVLHTAYRKMFSCKPVIPVASVFSEGVQSRSTLIFWLCISAPL